MHNRRMDRHRPSHVAVVHLIYIGVGLQRIQVAPCQGLRHAGQAGEQGEAGLQWRGAEGSVQLGCLCLSQFPSSWCGRQCFCQSRAAFT